MGILLGIFLFGCAVAAIVCTGLIFAMGALAPNLPSSLERGTVRGEDD